MNMEPMTVKMEIRPLTNEEVRTHLRPDEAVMWDALASPDARFVRAEYTIGVLPDRELRKLVGKDGMGDATDRASALIAPLAQAARVSTARVFLYRLACARAGVNLWPDEVPA